MKPSRSFFRAVGCSVALLGTLLVGVLSSGAYADKTGAPAIKKPGDLAAPTSHVTVPLADYQQLVSRPAVTALELLRIEGSFEPRDLSLFVMGKTTGPGATVELLKTTDGARLWGCEGQAVLSRLDGDKYAVTPLSSPSFSLRCRIELTQGGELRLLASAQVLWIESKVKDSELIRDDKEDGHQQIKVIHLGKDQQTALPVSATGRYHVRLDPDGVGFTYKLELRNPNRSLQPFAVNLRSGERVQTQETAMACEVQSGQTVCQVPPGEHVWTLTGSLPGTTFRPPISAKVHYLLLDAHPLLRPTVDATIARIAVKETGIVARHRGAQAFLLDLDTPLSWRVAKLAAMRTQTYAVTRALTAFYLGSEGSVIADATIELDNQGASELLLPLRGEPTYASLGGEPMLLTKNEAGALLLPLSFGPVQVGLQYRQTFSATLGFGLATLWLPELAAPATSTDIELRYDRQWLPLHEEFASQHRFPTASVSGLLLLVALFVVAERLLKSLGLAAALRFSAAAGLTGAAAAETTWFALLLLSELLVLGLFALPFLFRQKKLFWLVVGGLGLGGMWAVLLGALMFQTSGRPAQEQMAGPSSDLAYTRRAMKQTGQATDTPEATGGLEKGLPPKETLPHGSHRSYLYRERLSAQSRAVQVVMVSRPLVQAVGMGLFLLGVGLLLSRQKSLRQAVAGRVQLLRNPTP